MAYDVITFGSATIDVFMDTQAQEKKKKIEYPVGTKILVNKINFEIGGSGMNTAVSFRKFGFKTGFIGKVGNDTNGKIIIDYLKKNDIKFLGAIGNQITGYSIVLDSIKHNRTILFYRGENRSLKFSELRNIKNIKTKWFYMSSMIGESFKTQKKLAKLLKNRGALIAYNIGVEESKRGIDYTKDILKLSDILILNREEAYMLTRKKTIEKSLKLLGELVDVVCITDGSKPAYCTDGSSLYKTIPHKINIVERTGAGDAFASGFLAGLIKGNDIEYALQLGLANSESVVQYFGALNKLLTWSSAVKRIKDNPCKVKMIR